MRHTPSRLLPVALVLLAPFVASATSLVASSAGRPIQLIDPQTGAVIQQYEAPAGSGLFTSLGEVLAVDRRLLVTAKAQDAVLEFDLLTGAYLGVFISSALDNPQDVALRETELLISNVEGDNILRFDIATGALLGYAAEAGQILDPWNFSVASDGDIYSGHFDNVTHSIRHFDAATGAYIETLLNARLENPQSLVFGSDGLLYVGIYGEVHRYDLSTQTLVDVFSTVSNQCCRTGTWIGDMAFSPEGDLYAAVFGQNRGIYRMDGHSGAVLNRILPTADVYSIAFASVPEFSPYPLVNLVLVGLALIRTRETIGKEESSLARRLREVSTRMLVRM